MMSRIGVVCLVWLGVAAGSTERTASADESSSDAPASTAKAAPAPPAARGQKTAVVTATRIRVGDVMPQAGADVADVDLGPSPMAGGSRLVTKADILAAVDRKQLPAPAGVPDAVRVTRKVRHLAAADIDTIVRSAIAAKELSHGVSLAAVRAERPVDVADGWNRVEIDVPRAPKKAGSFSTMAIASLFVGDDVIARLSVPVELAVSSDGATYDVARGASVTLVIQRSLVEVRTPSFAAADADVGDAIVVQLRPSGRVVRARLVSRDQAIAIDGDR